MTDPDPFGAMRKYAGQWTDKMLLNASENFKKSYDKNAIYLPESMPEDLAESAMQFYGLCREYGVKADEPPKITGNKSLDRTSYVRYYGRLYNALSHFVGGDFADFNRLQLAFFIKERFSA